MGALRHPELEPAQLLLERNQIGGAGERVLPQTEAELERRALVVEGDPRALGQCELASVQLGLARQDAQQGRLAGAVRPGERDAVLALDAERDAVEEHGAGQLLAQIVGYHDRHDPRVGGIRKVSA